MTALGEAKAWQEALELLQLGGSSWHIQVKRHVKS